MKKLLYSICIAAIAIGCKDDEYQLTPFQADVQASTGESVDYTSGSADFSTYVSVGNSLTAGYSDGALFIEGQENSMPNIIASQMALAGGGSFTQPLMADNVGGLLMGGNLIANPRLVIDFSTGAPAPVPVSGTPTTDIMSPLSGPFNNMGVPGAKSFHLLAPGYGALAGVPVGSANPYYARMATAQDATVIGDAMQMSPTFFSLWIGANDILGFATSGGAGVDQKGNFDPSTYGGNDITDPNVFAATYEGLVQTLISGGAKGVVANLPSVTAIPYFTTVPHNAIPLDEATATMLNGAFAAYNGGLAQLAGLGMITPEELAKRTVSFAAGNNAALILDEDLTDLTGINPALTNMRQATAADLLVLTSQTILGTTVGGNPTLINGVSVPLADQWVLTPEEQQMVADAQAAYNATIEAIATKYELAFFDAKGAMDNLLNGGITMNGITSTAAYGTGGAFSLDGVHPSPRGYSLLANLMMEEINAKYGSNLPMVNVGNYKPIYFDN